MPLAPPRTAPKRDADPRGTTCVLVVCCVDLDDDLGRKAGVASPVIGRRAVEDAAVALASADPEDSDVNVLFEGIHVLDEFQSDDGAGPAMADDEVTVAAITGSGSGSIAATREVGREIERVLDRLAGDDRDDVSVIVVTDGAQDESVLPVIRSRVTVDGVRRVVVRQAQDLESMYYTIKQVLDDPETRGTILLPIGIVLLLYPLAVLAEQLNVPGATVFGLLSAGLGFYLLGRGLGVEETVAEGIAEAREVLFAGRVAVITNVVAGALLLVAAITGYQSVQSAPAAAVGAAGTLGHLGFGAVRWLTAAAVTSSLGRIVDGYLSGSFEWAHLNAPFYALSIGAVLHAVSAYLIQASDLAGVAAALAGGTILGLASTLTFAVVESRFGATAG
jgi:putative membrane protein